MFDLDRFIADLRATLPERSRQPMREVVARAVADPAALVRAIGAPDTAGVQVLYRSPELTVLNRLWGPRQVTLPHDHRMSAVIGMDEGREVFRALNAVPELMALLEGSPDAGEFCRQTMVALTRLCTEHDLATTVCTAGMHIIMATIAHYEIDSKVLSVAFKLLGHLAFEASNLKAIVQHGGIQKIIRAITMHPDYRPLMVSAIQTLDNISSGSTENASIVIDEGGKELIQVIMESHADAAEIQRYGKSALLSISALEGLTRSAQITAKAARS